MEPKFVADSEREGRLWRRWVMAIRNSYSSLLHVQFLGVEGSARTRSGTFAADVTADFLAPSVIFTNGDNRCALHQHRMHMEAISFSSPSWHSAGRPCGPILRELGITTGRAELHQDRWPLSKTAAPGFAPSRPWGAGFVKGDFVSPLAASLLTGGEKHSQSEPQPAGRNELGLKEEESSQLDRAPYRGESLIATRSRARSKPTTPHQTWSDQIAWQPVDSDGRQYSSSCDLYVLPSFPA